MSTSLLLPVGDRGVGFGVGFPVGFGVGDGVLGTLPTTGGGVGLGFDTVVTVGFFAIGETQ